MDNDISFITNQNETLRERFATLIQDTPQFDCLVGYFYASGFYALQEALEKTKKIRILVGIHTDKKSYEMQVEANRSYQLVMDFSHAQTKQKVEDSIVEDLSHSEDTLQVEIGIYKFIEWIRSKKLEIRAYPSQRIHAKLYIMTFEKEDRDKGRVITGSSNFTEAGLSENIEFNVELKNRSDYEFAITEFEKLWKQGVEVSEKYVQTIQKKTWLSKNITPYQLYLKFLYEYFQDELKPRNELTTKYLPQNFKKLEYQEQAVLNAKKILLEYGGVFISDVVGLGKTYISAMLADKLDGRTLVIAPPVLLAENNLGSWKNVFSDFKVHADFESLGKLDELLKRGVEQYENIIIDEAHRFRNESTVTYETLAKIIRGKKTILVTATPYNNHPRDILSLLKLFQNTKTSTIPNLPNLELFFNELEANLRSLDRKKDKSKYIQTTKENSRKIRNQLLKYLMVRRTRTEIQKYFLKDMDKENLRFPKIEKPTPLFYILNKEENNIFEETIDLISNKFLYTRYQPLLYYTGKMTALEEQSQRNMSRFMKILLVKRLESSFYAFKQSVERFIYSYTLFLRELENGFVYVSKKYSHKIFELLEEGNDEAVQDIINQGKAKKYKAKDFNENFPKDLKKDLQTLKKIQTLWKKINRDPKLLKFLNELSKNSILKKNHLILFTESKETANYLFQEIEKKYSNITLLFTGDSSNTTRNKVIENFDAKARHKSNQYRILIATEVLSEGVNLHRSNVVINYDIPWNPTRMMQRVGRINRVDTQFENIYTFNFFPTAQANDEIKLKEAAESKINAFLTLLGGDAELLTDGEPIDSHELFDRLLAKSSIEGEEVHEESELKYLKLIRDIRDHDPDLFESIKNLPKKARTAKKNSDYAESLLSYFRKGKLQKFFLAKPNSISKELDFIQAAKLLESDVKEKKNNLHKNFYELLDKNKERFQISTNQELSEYTARKGKEKKERELYNILRGSLKTTSQFTDEQESYLEKLLQKLDEGGSAIVTHKINISEYKS